MSGKAQLVSAVITSGAVAGSRIFNICITPQMLLSARSALVVYEIVPDLGETLFLIKLTNSANRALAMEPDPAE
eukprot:3401682-Ditylum_brightwellii.AAC.1